MDDAPLVLDMVRYALTSEGYHVTTCLQSTQALRLAHEQQPDVIMLDIVMPELSGWEVLAQLRADPLLSHAPVIICTAYVSEALGHLRELRGEGERDIGILPKPFEIDELLDVVRSITGGPGDAPVQASIYGREN